MDWPGLINAGLHGLRMAPSEFWQLTPAELQVMLGKTQQSLPMGRVRLSELLKTFPDAEKEQDDG